MHPIASLLVLSAAASCLAACEASPQKPANLAAARASAPPKYIETGTRISTDHPQVYPDLGVMSQSALQDAINDHTGPGYNQTGPIPSPQ
jgi:hypothetical protein